VTAVSSNRFGRDEVQPNNAHRCSIRRAYNIWPHLASCEITVDGRDCKVVGIDITMARVWCVVYLAPNGDTETIVPADPEGLVRVVLKQDDE
jgi:hypothetical protein